MEVRREQKLYLESSVARLPRHGTHPERGTRWAAYGEMLTPEEATRRLREQGSRMTAARRAVLQLLAGNRTHPTAEGIAGEVRRQLGSVPLATIYNVLEALEAVGMVRRIVGLEPRAHFDPDTSPHEHALCTQCLRVWDVAPRQAPADLPKGFAVSGMLIQGVCFRCRREEFRRRS